MNFGKLLSCVDAPLGAHIRLLLAVIALCFVSGCSRIKIAYNYADWFVAARVDSYFDLNSEQKELVDKDLKAFFDWHRKSMLPGFAQYFRQQATNVRASKMGPVEYKLARDGFLGLFYGTMEGVYPGAARLLTTLTPEQIANYEKKIQAENAEAEAGLARSSELIQTERAESTVKFLRRWVGYMPEKQQAKIRAYSAELVWPGKEWFELRLANQARFLELLRKKAPEKEIIAYLRQIMTDPEARATKVFRAKMRAFNVKSVDTVVKILGTLDATQREYLASRFDDFAQDFEELAAEK